MKFVYQITNLIVSQYMFEDIANSFIFQSVCNWKGNTGMWDNTLPLNITL
jgi:hypothetical protein